MANKAEVPKGKRECPHCKGWTTCNCGSCGVRYGDGEQQIDKGICKVCKGTGSIDLNS